VKISASISAPALSLISLSPLSKLNEDVYNFLTLWPRQ
jgi:hypothetical protein